MRPLSTMNPVPSMRASETPQPLVLIATTDEWTSRSVAAVLESDGYTVLRTSSGQDALELSRHGNVDAILLEDSLDDIAATEVCRTLHDDPLFDHAIPIFITAPAPVPHMVRSKAYLAGAWDYCSQPLDADAFCSKLRTFTRARRELMDLRVRECRPLSTTEDLKPSPPVSAA